MPKGDEILLRHMLDAAYKAVSFAKGKPRADLDSDEMLSLATIRLLEIMGEAARSLSQVLKIAIQRYHGSKSWGLETG